MAKFPKIRLGTRVDKRSKNQQDALDEMTKIIGEVTVASNAVQLKYKFMFSLLIYNRNVSPGFAIWDTIKSDATQREMLENLAKWHLEKYPKSFERLCKAIQLTKTLGIFRNFLVHSPVFFSEDNKKLKAVHFEFFSHDAIKYFQAHPKILSKAIISDYRKMESFLTILDFHVRMPEQVALPRLPALKSIKLKNEFDAENNRVQQKLAHERQRLKRLRKNKRLSEKP